MPEFEAKVAGVTDEHDMRALAGHAVEGFGGSDALVASTGVALEAQ